MLSTLLSDGVKVQVSVFNAFEAARSCKVFHVALIAKATVGCRADRVDALWKAFRNASELVVIIWEISMFTGASIHAERITKKII